MSPTGGMQSTFNTNSRGVTGGNPRVRLRAEPSGPKSEASGEPERGLPPLKYRRSREEVTHMLEWLAAAVDFIASIFLAETVSWS